MTTKMRENQASRTGNRKTIFEIRKNPLLKGDTLIDPEMTKFPFIGGGSYKGDWVGNKREGFGVEVTTSGTKYEGEFRAGKYHGRGTFWGKSKKGLRKEYAGEWENGHRSGRGEMFYENGDVYVGSFIRGRKHGSGKLTYADGGVYEGEFEDDEKNGGGIMRYANGNVFQGHYVGDKKEGAGSFYYASTCKMYIGEWVEDNARCGELRDASSEERGFYGGDAAPLHGAGHFTTPMLELADPSRVLASKVAEVRLERALSSSSSSSLSGGEYESSNDRRRSGGDEGSSQGGGGGAGEGGAIVSEAMRESISQAESLFSQMDTHGNGLVPLALLTEVFSSLLGAFFGEGEIRQLATQLEISEDTEVSLPEVVELCSYLASS